MRAQTSSADALITVLAYDLATGSPRVVRVSGPREATGGGSRALRKRDRTVEEDRRPLQPGLLLVGRDRRSGSSACPPTRRAAAARARTRTRRSTAAVACTGSGPRLEPRLAGRVLRRLALAADRDRAVEQVADARARMRVRVRDAARREVDAVAARDPAGARRRARRRARAARPRALGTRPARAPSESARPVDLDRPEVGLAALDVERDRLGSGRPRNPSRARTATACPARRVNGSTARRRSRSSGPSRTTSWRPRGRRPRRRRPRAPGRAGACATRPRPAAAPRSTSGCCSTPADIVKPGATQLTSTPSRPTSFASARVNATIAPLLVT